MFDRKSVEWHRITLSKNSHTAFSKAGHNQVEAVCILPVSCVLSSALQAFHTLGWLVGRSVGRLVGWFNGKVPPPWGDFALKERGMRKETGVPGEKPRPPALQTGVRCISQNISYKIRVVLPNHFLGDLEDNILHLWWMSWSGSYTFQRFSPLGWQRLVWGVG